MCPTFHQSNSLPGECKPTDAAKLPDVTHGETNHSGTAATGRRAGGGEDDSDYLRVPPHSAQNGGVRVPEGLHPLESR